jgi:hypothetical protein
MKGYNDILCDTIKISEGPEGFALALHKDGVELDCTTLGLRGVIMYLESCFDVKREALMEAMRAKAQTFTSFEEEDEEPDRVSVYFKKREDALAFFDFVTKDLRIEDILGVTVYPPSERPDYRVIIDGFRGD